MCWVDSFGDKTEDWSWPHAHREILKWWLTGINLAWEFVKGESATNHYPVTSSWIIALGLQTQHARACKEDATMANRWQCFLEMISRAFTNETRFGVICTDIILLNVYDKTHPRSW